MVKRTILRQGREWMPNQGLIDQILHLRTFPDPVALMSDDVVEVWRSAIDASLDIVIPQLKKIVLLPGPTAAHGSACITKSDAESIIGRVPLTRTEKEGWK